MKRGASKDEEIAQLERRLEIRRERLRRHYDAAREDLVERGHRLASAAGKAVGWLPLAAVAGGLVVGFAASRYPRRAAPAPMRHAYTEPAPHRARNFAVALLGIGATAMRIAASNEVRTMWHAVQTFRARRNR